jgi:hypothetical protein
MIKKFLCKIFGHKLFKSWRGQDGIQRYGNYLHCQRCGEKMEYTFSETPPPPTNSFCASGYSIRHYYQNILDGTWYGIAICGRNNR